MSSDNTTRALAQMARLKLSLRDMEEASGVSTFALRRYTKGHAPSYARVVEALGAFADRAQAVPDSTVERLTGKGSREFKHKLVQLLKG